MKAAWMVAVFGACTTPDQRTVEQAVTRQCPPQTVEGVDVYAGTGTIDWQMVKASGRDFAFIKATQGDYNRQATFAANWANAKAAGLFRSAYHFFDPTVDGTLQAQAFLNELQAGGGMGSDDLAAMLDLECPTSSDQATTQANCEYSGNSGWAPTATLVQRAFDWLTTVEQATGKKPFIYSYVSWFPSVGFTDARLAEYPLFIASYNTCASVPDPWTTAVFWQYSASGSVPGIAAQSDLDRFMGSAGDLATLAGTVPASDAGVSDGPTPDAGNPDNGDAGCGCRSGGVATLAWVLVAVPVVIGRRVRRSARRSRRSSQGSPRRRAGS